MIDSSDSVRKVRDSLDDAIDRAVREMTQVAADDDAVAVARVMARLREGDARRNDARERWTLAPRLAWAGAAALVLIAIVVTSYSLRSPVPDTRAPRIAKSAPTSTPTPSASAPSTHAAAAVGRDSSVTRSPQKQTVRETPTREMAAASTVHAATVADDERDAQSELPLESDIEIASITPAPLGEAPAIPIEPLITSSLQVDAIPLPSIEVPPVSPERRE